VRPYDHIKQLEERIIQQRLQIGELEKENLELKKKLAFYEGPHTPPSQRTLKEKDEKNTEKKKRGAPKGHRGATRPTPEPDQICEVVASQCEKCGGHNIEKLEDFEKSVREDIPPPQKIVVTQFNRWKVRCLDCGYQFTSKHQDCPQTGSFGIYLLVYMTMLKYHLRGVLRKIQDYLLYTHNFEISAKGIHDTLLRVGDVCRVEYDRKVEKVRNAKWRYIDETGFKINGEKRWLWIFRTNEDDVLVVIRKSRGAKVLDEILGEDHNGPDVVDGWRAYNQIDTTQRCWAHLIREVDDFKDVSQNGRQLSEEIHASYNTLKEFLDKGPPMEERKRQKATFEKKLQDIIDRYSKYKELAKPITYLQNGMGNWYTCFLYPGMEPTNNLGEQAMREHVIMRKIIGCFRSENGAENYQYIASLLATWKLQDKNIFEELEHLLRRKLCLS
jgi:transposase